MKITTRIISGYGLFIAVLAGLVIYQVITIKRMQDISTTLSGTNFENAQICLTAISDIDAVAEFTRKSYVSPVFQKQLQEYQEFFQGSLRKLQTHPDSIKERDEIRRLSQQWDAYNSDMALLNQSPSPNGTALPQSLEEHIENLKTRTRSLYQIILDSMAPKMESSRKTAETAVKVLWIVTASALAISILVSLLIIRSISKPLAHLTEGTRAIADGKFFYRLDTSRNDEFSQLARDFNKMTSRLNELDAMKKDFVSHVSHELKAPLASMRETIQLMLEEIPGPLTEKQKRLLELNLQSGMRLTAMISNLLDLSRTEAGVMEYEMKSQDLVSLVRNAVSELEPQARERQVHINASLPEKPLPVECDPDRIVQAILNLVGNAVKFSPKNAEVQVQVEELRHMPENIPERWQRLVAGAEKHGYLGLVTVSDSGPGIPDSDKENVFEKFHQVKQGKKLASQGVGLGLSICRTIVQAHRGAIWVENNPGGGSRFMLLLRQGQDGKESVPRASAPL
jgi:signal transduction histidine kinase